MKRVENEFPSLDVPYRLAIIGDSPGETEEEVGRPFVGSSGHLLHSVMSNYKIAKTGCFLGNVCQFRGEYEWDGEEYRDGFNKLQNDLNAFRPNCVLLMGQVPLRAAGVNFPVTSYRGSIFKCVDNNSPFFGLKCVSTLHPNFLIKSYDSLPLFAFDLNRARQQAEFAHLTPLNRIYEVELSAKQICERLDAIPDGVLTSVDIEGGVQQGITCVGICTEAGKGFIVNPLDFPTHDKAAILRSLSRVLGSADIPKVLQNSLYDNFCLQWKWKMPIRNVVFDTMLAGWEIYPELEKGLGVQSSIYTEQPYYKFERKIADKLTHYRYCITDAIVTREIAEKQIQILTPKARNHFEFNMQLLPAVNYMELRGIRYDVEKAATRLREVQSEQSQIQSVINARAGQDLNVNSPKQMTNVLYTKLGYEKQYAKEKGRKTTRLTSDVKALLKLFKSEGEHGLIHNILSWRVLEGQRKQLEIGADHDGRVRCSYNLVGTDTGRMTCYESPTGSGSNLTTIMKKNRDLYLADEGMEFFQCDLSGADGWTVASHSTRLGDPTMELDYLAGIKPAKVIAAMYLVGWEVASYSQAQMLELLSKLEIPKMLYFVCKVIQHGSNYQMGKITMAENILLQSWKKEGRPIHYSSADCAKLQSMYLDGRYKGIKHWWHWVTKELERTAQLECASGHTRTFFGRPGANETIKTALSHEPQANTTYATNLAMHRMWHDAENRRADGSFIIEPLHQVHDALCGQYPIELRSWAHAKLNEYFSNPLTIADRSLTIPFGMGVGRSWGELEGDD